MAQAHFNGPRTVNTGAGPRKITPESFTRSLEHHLARGNIKEYHRAPDGAWVVQPWRSDTVVIRSARDAAIFAAGLAAVDIAHTPGEVPGRPRDPASLAASATTTDSVHVPGPAPSGDGLAGQAYTYSFAATVPEGVEAGDVATELADAMDRVDEHWAIGALTLERAPDPGRASLTDLDLARQPLRNWLGGHGDIDVHEAAGHLLDVLQAYISRELPASVGGTVDFPDDGVRPAAPDRSAGGASQRTRVQPATQSTHRGLS